ncbi:hypothetical protein SUDANB176_01069 [Streptomyces sp. enrichment culture]
MPYAAVEGDAPFRRTSTFSTLTAVGTEPLPGPRRAGPLTPVLRRLMDKRPESRPTAEEARALLEAVAGATGADTSTTSLRAPATPLDRGETERGVPAMTSGFGPPRPPAPGTGATGPGADGAHAVPGAATSAGADADRLRSPAPTGRDEAESGAPQDEPDGEGGTTAPATGPPASTAPAEAPGEDASGSSGTAGDDGGATTPAPACRPTGGGKYNCRVGRTAKSCTDSGTEVGVLDSGTDYFYCRQNLGRRETYRECTNVWWARTDDDGGNTGVRVGVVYGAGGDNDGPVPGLPVC